MITFAARADVVSFGISAIARCSESAPSLYWELRTEATPLLYQSYHLSAAASGVTTNSASSNATARVTAVPRSGAAPRRQDRRSGRLRSRPHSPEPPPAA